MGVRGWVVGMDGVRVVGGRGGATFFKIFAFFANFHFIIFAFFCNFCFAHIYYWYLIITMCL